MICGGGGDFKKEYFQSSNTAYGLSLKKCNLTLKRAHLPVTRLIVFTPELQLAIDIKLLLAVLLPYCRPWAIDNELL